MTRPPALLFALAIGGASVQADVDAAACKLRPITITVTDAQTGKPLEGILVRYLVLRGTFRTSWLWIFPPIEPLVERKIEVKKIGTTDAKGQLAFQSAEVDLKEHPIRNMVDRIDSEILLVNLAPSDEAERFYSGEQKKLILPAIRTTKRSPIRTSESAT